MMLEAKPIAYFGTGLATYVSSFFLGEISPDPISQYIEKGGTVLTIAILGVGIRAVYTKLNEREKRLDDMHDKQLEADVKNAEARIQLSQALDKLSDTVSKK